MNPKSSRWIARKLADQIFEAVIRDDGSTVVYVVEAGAGMGKTYCARDIGVRLGSPTGYEPVRQGSIIWCGILDLYDPDTNNNQSIERRLIQALSPRGREFEDYDIARDMYDNWFKGGIAGSGLEDQRRKIERAFADGLRAASERYRPVLVFDTVERLERAADPTQRALGFYDDTASVMGWLAFQISQLRHGVVVLLGRRPDQLFTTLEQHILETNPSRRSPIQLERVTLLSLDPQEQDAFFAHRRNLYPELERLLTTELAAQLGRTTKGSPLLLDIAILALLEANNPSRVIDALREDGDLWKVELALLDAHMNALNNLDRQMLLRYLALARNGLFTDLLRHLEPNAAERLLPELRSMESLPYVKVRDIATTDPERPRRTYFLHDAMYSLCDEALLKPQEVAQDSQRITQWYEAEIGSLRNKENKGKLTSDERRALNDLLVQSLIYRLRSSPKAGYQWFLREEHQSILGAQTGLDMGLRDAMALFLENASLLEESPGQSLSSSIDRANIQADYPSLIDTFALDSAVLWIKRLTLRGQRDAAVELGERMLSTAEDTFMQNPDEYRLAYAEFLLWYGQAIMYAKSPLNALQTYAKVLETIEVPRMSMVPLGDFEQWRMNLVRGRTHNNIGYTNWMYQGKYRKAVEEFVRAISLFQAANLQEEWANSSDNLGRVYGQLGSQFRSIRLIKNGLEGRRQLGLTFREALSETSLAQVQLRFGEFGLAMRAVERALIHFRTLELQRGIGLGLLTQGMINRFQAESWRDMDISLQEALRYTDRAEPDLREAVGIFTGPVKEPIRAIQAHNELACNYRARYLLLSHSNAADSAKDLAYSQARLHFREAIKLAVSHGYLIEQLDSVQDRAVLYMRASKFDEVDNDLAEIRGLIPSTHKIIEEVGLVEPANDDRVDAYYKLMGQVELLAGALTYEQGRFKTGALESPAPLPDKESLLETARHYLLAVAYFNQYSDEAYVQRQTYDRIYRRLSECDPETRYQITHEYLPIWMEQYKLPQALTASLFREVFGLPS